MQYFKHFLNIYSMPYVCYSDMVPIKVGSRAMVQNSMDKEKGANNWYVKIRTFNIHSLH